MTTKLEPSQSVTRELSVEINAGESENEPGTPIVATLNGNGTVDIRLKGRRRVVTVDLMSAIFAASGHEDLEPVVFTLQEKTAQKRTLTEHLLGM